MHKDLDDILYSTLFEPTLRRYVIINPQKSSQRSKITTLKASLRVHSVQ